jgi:hypothetical protein
MYGRYYVDSANVPQNPNVFFMSLMVRSATHLRPLCTLSCSAPSFWPSAHRCIRFPRGPPSALPMHGGMHCHSLLWDVREGRQRDPPPPLPRNLVEWFVRSFLFSTFTLFINTLLIQYNATFTQQIRFSFQAVLKGCTWTLQNQ